MARGVWRYDSVPGFQGVCLGCGMASEDARLFLAVRGTGETELMAVHPGCWPEDLDDKRFFVISMTKLIAGMKHGSVSGGGATEASTPLRQWVESQNAKVLRLARAETQGMIDAMKASILLEVCDVAREKVEEQLVRDNPSSGRAQQWVDSALTVHVSRDWVEQYVREQREAIRNDVWSNAMEHIERRFRDLIRSHDKHILRVVREAFRRAGA